MSEIPDSSMPARYSSPPGDFSTFIKNGDSTFTRTLKNGTQVNFDAQGLQTSIVDRNGNTTSYAYDARGRLSSITDPVGLVTRLTYDSHLTSITDPAGRTTRFEHDEGGNLVRITDADGTSRQFAYDSRHRVVSRTGKRGFVTRYEYDSAGRHVKSTMPDGSTRLISPSEAVGLADLAGGRGTSDSPADVVRPDDPVATFTDGNGNTTTYLTNRFGSATETTDPLSRRSMTPRDKDGLRGRSVSFNETVTIATFEDGNLVMEKEAVGTPLEREAQYEYHPTFNKLTRVVDPAGGVTTLDYDARGNLIKVTNALGGEQTFSYDGRGLRLTSTGENGNLTRWTYDANGNLETVTDALGHTSHFTRNSAGIVTSVTQAAGGAEEWTFSYAYDTLNRLVERVDGTGAGSRYQYDADGNRTETETSTGQTIARSYDEMGRLTRILDPARGETLFTYDALNRVTQAATQDLGHQPAVTLNYTYDALGQLSRLTDSQGGVISYDYDAQGRLTELLTSAGGSFSLAHDPAGRIVERIYPNGTVTDYRYDPTGRLASLTHALPEATTSLAAYEYSYDDVGNITSIAEGSQTRRFTYDSMRRLITGGTAANPETYSYDTTGNRTGSSLSQLYRYDDDDRLLGDDDFTYGYDENGNQVSKTSKAGGATANYSYDAFNRLEQITFSDGATANYRYDGLGRRIEKSVNGAVTQYVYDGLDTLLEFGANGALTARYAYGGVDQPLSMERGGESYYYHADHQRSIRLLTDSNGSVVNSYSYDSYGRRLAVEEVVANPFTYTGREYDDESGLYHYRARYYDPQTGRFLSQDPLGLATAGSNRYQYVRGNPVNRIDTLGLADHELGIALIGFGGNLEFAAYGLYEGITLVPWVFLGATVGWSTGTLMAELTFVPGQRAEVDPISWTE